MLVYQRVTPTVVLVNKPIYELPMQRNGGQPAPSKGCSRNWDAAPRSDFNCRVCEISKPSGKRLHNYGKAPFLMGKSTINGHFQ